GKVVTVLNCELMPESYKIVTTRVTDSAAMKLKNLIHWEFDSMAE
ncbi:hypothetical protein AVEN_27852-1, partial [Araneus ventricosus]